MCLCAFQGFILIFELATLLDGRTRGTGGTEEEGRADDDVNDLISSAAANLLYRPRMIDQQSSISATRVEMQ